MELFKIELSKLTSRNSDSTRLGLGRVCILFKSSKNTEIHFCKDHYKLTMGGSGSLSNLLRFNIGMAEVGGAARCFKSHLCSFLYPVILGGKISLH